VSGGSYLVSDRREATKTGEDLRSQGMTSAIASTTRTALWLDFDFPQWPPRIITLPRTRLLRTRNTKCLQEITIKMGRAANCRPPIVSGDLVFARVGHASTSTPRPARKPRLRARRLTDQHVRKETPSAALVLHPRCFASHPKMPPYHD
jgi:hypothetical protein